MLTKVKINGDPSSNIDVPNKVDGQNMTCVIPWSTKVSACLHCRYIWLIASPQLPWGDQKCHSWVNGTWRRTSTLDIPSSHQGERRTAVDFNCCQTWEGCGEWRTIELQLQGRLCGEQVLMLQAQASMQFEVPWWSKPQLHQSRDRVGSNLFE